MPNSDNTYGTYNKQTKIFSQADHAFSTGDGFRAKTTFANVTAAKNHYLSTDAQTIFDECCTNLQWAVINDGDGNATQLKVTFDFGTKGGNIAASEDWAGQFNSRKNTLIASGDTNWSPGGGVVTDSTDHLF